MELEEKELKKALSDCDWQLCANRITGRCECCSEMKNLISVIAEKEDESSNFEFCILCIEKICPKEFANACKMALMTASSDKRYKEERKKITTNITEAIETEYPQLKRNLDNFLDGRLTLSDGKEHETLSDIYSKTIAKSRIPSEAQVNLFNNICSSIASMKNQGIEYKEKYDGVEVDNLISGLSVAVLQEKHVEAFENIKKWYEEKGWVTMKQLNFLKVMDNAKKL